MTSDRSGVQSSKSRTWAQASTWLTGEVVTEAGAGLHGGSEVGGHLPDLSSTAKA